jgi:enoyl-[acyl-carrier-protein] reductase (NADH)
MVTVNHLGFETSDISEYITGQLILVDGGFTIGTTKAII